MKPSELFALLLKVLGVWQVVLGLGEGPAAVATMMQIPGDFHWPLAYVLVGIEHAGLRVIIGCTLFLMADWLARKVYPPAP